jgi:hypothetical protein
VTRPDLYWFDPTELTGAGEEPTPAELASIETIARALGSLRSGEPDPGRDFPDRVMAAIAAEPEPAPLLVVLDALRRGRPAVVVSALGDAWRDLIGSGRPLLVRAQAIALLAATLILAAAIGGGAAVGAERLLELHGPLSPSPSSSMPIGPSLSPDVTPSPSFVVSTQEPIETLEPSETPEPSETLEPSETPEPSETLEPNEMPEPSETPEPSEKPEGGSGGQTTPTPEPGESD